MTGWGWGAPNGLWLLLLVPMLVVGFAFDGQRRRRLIERIGHQPMIARMTASYSPGRRRWKAILTVTAMTLLLLALAQPHAPGRARLAESRGLDLVVALDFSRSMLARDVYPSRLDRAKAELAHLIDTLKGDRVGVVAFAGETMSSPLTVDYEAAKLFWRDLTPDDMPVGGTDLGRAITAASELLTRVRKPDAKRKPAQVILLLTDGEDTEGRGLSAARAAAQAGIKIFTLGIGSTDRPYVQLFDEEGRATGTLADGEGRPVRVGLDEAALRQMAQLTAGDYFFMDPHRFGVERVQQAIAGLERTEEEARLEREPDDIARYLLLPAFLLLAAEALVRERRRTAMVKPIAGTEERGGAGGGGGGGARGTAALLLLLMLPMMTGFDLFTRRDPDVEEGNKLLQAGKAEEALRAYDRAIASLPDEPIVHFDRGAALYELGKFPEAQKEFQRASEGHDAQVKADAYYNMGNALFKQERWKESLDAYKHALGLRPEDRRAKWNLELALRRLQEQKQKKQQQAQQDQKQDQKQQDQKQDQKQQQQAQQDQKQQDQKQQDQKQQQAQQDQKQQEQKQQDQKQQEQKQQDQKQQQAQQDQKQDQKQDPKRDQKQQDQAAQDQKERDEKRALAKKEPPRDIDKQDAEAVLDALERVEPTVQKDLARRRAGSRRPTKDW